PSVMSYCASAHRLYPHHFPTRRSSDLDQQPRACLVVVVGVIMVDHAGGEIDHRDRRAGCPGNGRAIRPQGGGQIVTSDLPSVEIDRKSTRLNSSHVKISYAVFCLKKKT